jgi:excisionase family DNA binding protein
MDEILTAGAVAAMFGVNRKTITRWCNAGRLPHFRTLGGHRRFRRSEVEPLLATKEAS